MKPSVTGFFCEPSISTSLPCLTVTARLQASGQSSGHAVSMTDAGPPSGVMRWRGLVGLAIWSAIIAYVAALPHVVIVGGGFGGLFAARGPAGRAVRVPVL